MDSEVFGKSLANLDNVLDKSLYFTGHNILFARPFISGHLPLQSVIITKMQFLMVFARVSEINISPKLLAAL
jgi:hypothetical protein